MTVSSLLLFKEFSCHALLSWIIYDAMNDAHGPMSISPTTQLGHERMLA